MVVFPDIELPVQEVLVAADVLRQSEVPCADTLAPPINRQSDDSHQQQEASTSEPAAAIPAGPSMTLVNGQLEHGVALQHADAQVTNFGLWF